MKSFILAATMIFSASTFAGGYEPIHDYSQALGAIKVKNACVTDTEVRSIHSVRVCTNLEARTTDLGGEGGIFTDWVCTAWEMQDLAYPRAFERTVCLKNAPINEASSGECLKWGTKSDFLPDTIKIRTVMTHGEVTTERSGYHTFPSCN